jgi:beta-RFAP synthase
MRSGIGIGLFRHGGLVVDGGRGWAETAPPLLARLAVPADWRLLLIMDRAQEGLSGRREVEAFARLPQLPESEAAAICRLVLMQALPSVAEDDLEGFGAAITRIQEILGDHFAPAQGGRFTSRRVAQVIAAAGALGAVGLGQSSWGPTGFAFVRGNATAERIARHLAQKPDAAGLDIMICRALNRGASVTAQ